ncbi:phytoene synthase [Methylohalomonas lacus]|uniref:Phytoene synthase n=1 Tax=Methylohalomonas lacus TaxID=398773 RepID=A0AAE3HL29_9GAMM|nr:squalene/phytoene synthase family protein [Methylohalomonas lacus]MCS3902428.1 phytoene synthase [Methylohalomonas lacus]
MPTAADNASGVDYFIAQAAPTGSALYYACLFSDPARRSALLAWHALEHELLKSLTDIQDPGVARLRLQWWAEEMQRVAAGHARHPLGQALQPAFGHGRPAMMEVIDAIARLQDAVSLPDRELASQLDADYQRHFAPLWRLSAQLGGVDSDAALDAAAELGQRHHELRALQALPQTLAQGLCRPLARADLAHAGLAETTDLTAPDWRNLLAQKFTQLRQRIEQLRLAYPAAAAPHFLHGLILARLDAALAGEIVRDGCHIGSRQYALTPIRRLWLAWRTRRALRRRLVTGDK